MCYAQLTNRSCDNSFQVECAYTHTFAFEDTVTHMCHRQAGAGRAQRGGGAGRSTVGRDAGGSVRQGDDVFFLSRAPETIVRNVS